MRALRVVAVALTVLSAAVGCTGGDDEAGPTGTTTTVAVSDQVSESAPGTGTDRVDRTSGSSHGPGTVAVGTSAPTGADSGSAPSPSARGGHSTDAPAVSGTGRPVPTTTIGGPASLDTAGETWFRTFCTAMSPLVDMRDLSSRIDPADLESSLQLAAESMHTLGTAFTDAARELRDATPPTFDGGRRFADRIVDDFATLGPRFTELGDEFAAADPTDPQVMADLNQVGDQVRAAIAPLEELQRLQIAPATLNAILRIPACASLGS